MLQKYWLANGLNISNQFGLALQAKEGRALFFLSAATLPFLVYSILFDFSYQQSPVEYVSYILLFIYDLFLFLKCLFNKSFRVRLRPWVVFALPFAAFVQYFNMYVSGPTIPNMFSSIIVMVFASVILQRNLEFIIFGLFFIVASATVVFLRQDYPLVTN